MNRKVTLLWWRWGGFFHFLHKPFFREEWFLFGGAAGDVYVDKHTADVMI